ncbi:MAG TPA: SDR family NAD(P)-dependent oxidoreductase [Actinocrinis sp.]|nr:SDR family NAD(P)-dependent oxidoreductase [Actinocrinis sp.]
MTEIGSPLSGQVALVTGATGGIGSAIALHLADLGAAVAINHLDEPDEAHRLCEQLRTRGAEAVAIQADVREPGDVNRLAEEASFALGPVDTVVSAAGNYPRIPWTELDPAQWNSMISTNLTSHFLVARAFTESMQAQGQGRIIAVGSVLAHIGRHELAAYIAAKAGVEGLIRALARELGPDGITANCVAPGSIRVRAEETVVDDVPEMEKRQLARQCIKRRGTPADVAQAVGFLAQRGAGFITGQTIYVDGGWFLG